MANFQIDIISDTVCPWCYIGHRRLQRAISAYQSQHPTSTFSTTYHAFYLNPSAPSPSVDKAAYMASRFPAAQLAAIHSRLTAAGRDLGITFSFGGKTGNTRSSHLLIELGRLRGVQTAVVEQLFAAYFEAEEDITDFAVLVKRGVAGGLDEDEAWKWLRSDGGGEEVDSEVNDAKRRGISGVPHFTVNGKRSVSGAQGESAFLEIFEELAAEEN